MTRRAAIVAVAALLLGGGGCSASSASSSSSSGASSSPSSGPSDAAEWIAEDEHDALFTVDCPFSHRASDDPIVHPGHPGASHSHEFFGSAATDASSTGESLRGTETTCEDTADTAAYWVPTLSVDGVPVDPTFVRAYYRATPGADVRDVQAPPLGLAMIAGDPALGGDDHDHGGAGGRDHGGGEDDGGGGAHDHHGGSAPAAPAEGPTAAAGWGCGLSPRTFRVEPPTDCTDPSPLTLRLLFPDCWDGERLDSDDHRSHVAASVDGACPDSHPVLMTQLQVSVVWPVTGAEAGRANLSSGPMAGAHGDFLNGWEPDALEGHIELCIRAKANCTIG